MMWLCTEYKLISLSTFALSISADNLYKAEVLLFNCKICGRCFNISIYVVYENHISDNPTQ